MVPLRSVKSSMFVSLRWPTIVQRGSELCTCNSTAATAGPSTARAYLISGLGQLSKTVRADRAIYLRVKSLIDVHDVHGVHDVQGGGVSVHCTHVKRETR